MRSKNIELVIFCRQTHNLHRVTIIFGSKIVCNLLNAEDIITLQPGECLTVEKKINEHNTVVRCKPITK